MMRWAMLGASLVLAAIGALRSAEDPWRFAQNAGPFTMDAPARFERVFDYVSPTGAAHAPAIRLMDGSAAVMWFDGTREAHPDVQILGASIDAPDEIYQVLTAQGVGRGMDPRQAVRIMGNIIQMRPDSPDFMATIVSVGGWAAASIAHVAPGPDTLRARKLTLSPFLNRSHLVRAPSVTFENGDIGIPAYFEMGTAFGEFIRMTPQGRVVDKRRMTHGIRAIQPVIVPASPTRAVAFLRNFDAASDGLVAVWTEDGGRSWSAPELLDVPNPDAPVAALRLADGGILMAFNDSPTRADTLDLAASGDDGRTWRRIGMVEDGRTGPMAGLVRYPTMRRLPDGRIVLAYSYGDKRGIRAAVFTDAWVMAQ